MSEQKNIINGSNFNNTGDIITGDNNFILKVLLNPDYQITKSLKAIQRTKNVLDKISNNISGVNLKRDLSDVSFDDLLNDNQFIFISGVAGSGKSVYAKQLLESLNDTCIISFVADQFLESSLITTLNKINIDDSLEDVFNEFVEFPKMLIYIDSFEKLLEGEAESFKELVVVLRQNVNIKMVVSCRDYALETLKFNFFNFKFDKSNTIEVPVLTDDEVAYFVNEIPSLRQIVSNKNLIEILRIPKYLSLAEKLISKSDNDFSGIDEITFKKELWKNIVEGTITTRGINKERSKAFISITLKRAKELSILTNVDDFNLDAVNQLKTEGVLFEENSLYAPSHDIFEDWGLIKYFEKYKIENPIIIDFYKNLGNEPAIRRGYRLWIESSIEESVSWIYNFISETINNQSIDNHWKDEILTAIIKSSFCEKYFNENNEHLLKDNCALLKRFIHLVKISGKDSNQVPNNKGWDVLIKFIYEKLDKLEYNYDLILRLLFDWEMVLYAVKTENVFTPKYVGEIIYKILNDYNQNSTLLNVGVQDSLIKNSIKLFYQLAEYIPDEIKITLDDILLKEINPEDYKKRDLRGVKIKYALSHFHSGTLPKYFPDELIELANNTWKYKEKKSKSRFGFEHSETGIEHHFGITNKHDFSYFPQSSYQTFTYKLLKSNPWKALDFIIDFTNYVSDKYIKSEFLKDDGFGRKGDEIIDIELIYNEVIYEIKGSDYLWSVNRGGQTTVPSLLQSVVIALEKYLYELGLIESDRVDEIIQTFFDKIYTKSNSVILLSVLSSIAMAFPKKVGNKLLPLLSDKHFFIWDRHRWMNERSAGSLLNFPNSSWEGNACDKERKEALNWEHRNKYHTGLQRFIFEYQLRYGNLDGEIFKMFDLLKNKINEDDVYGKKILVEIDMRNQKIEKIESDEGKVMLQISPNYSIDKDLEKVMIKNEQESIITNKDAYYNLWVTNIYKRNSDEKKEYKYWNECYKYITDQDNFYIDPISAFPVGTFAVLGLELFDSELNDVEFKFCIETILDLAQKLFEKQKKEYDFENIDFSVSIYDNESIYKFLPKLLKFKQRITTLESDKTYALMFFYLRDLNIEKDSNIKYFYKSFKEFLWEIDFDFAQNCFVAIVKYAEFNKKHPRHKHYSDEEIQKIRAEENLILNFIENNNNEYTFNNISYSNCSQWDLKKALYIFPTNKVFYFSYDFIKLIFESQVESYSLNKDEYGSTDFYKIGHLLQEILVEFLLENEITANSKVLFHQIIDINFNLELRARNQYYLKEYVDKIIESLYYKVDRNTHNEIIVQRFWIYWDELYSKIKDNDNYNKEFLFYSDYWKTDAEDWIVLDKKSDEYLFKIENLKYVNLKALTQLLSGIGFKKLMPNGLRVLVKNLKIDTSKIDYYYGEKLIMNCFKQNVKNIKEDRILLDEFLWLLDLMINLGSSKAYLIRENLIIYKKPLINN